MRRKPAKNNKSNRRGTGKRLQNAVALLLLAASLMSLGGLAFAAEPEGAPIATDSAASSAAPSPSSTTAPEGSDAPEATPVATPVTTPVATPAATPIPTPIATPEGTSTPDASPTPSPESSAAPGADEDDEDDEGEEDADMVGIPATLALNDNIPVQYFVALNGKWTDITPEGSTSDGDGTYQFAKGGARYYVTAATLEGVYAQYGFTAADYKGELFFPHTKSDDTSNRIYADAAPEQVTLSEEGDTEWRIPLINSKSTAIVYYTPKNASDHDTYFTGNKLISDSALISASSFYTVTAEANGLCAEEDAAPTITPASPIPAGETVKVTLPKLKAGAFWRVTDGTRSIDPQPDKQDNPDGSIKYTIKGIASRHVFTAQTELTVEYDASLVTQLDHSVKTHGAVNKERYFTEPAGSGEYYTVRPVDNDLAIGTKWYGSYQRPMYYTFTGWRCAATGELFTAERVLRPNELKLTQEELQAAADGNGTVKLTAEWTPYIQNTSGEDLIASANFYVGLDVEIHANDFDYKPTNPEHFTQSVYTTRVTGTPDFKKPQSGQHQLVKQATKADEANDTNTHIRELIYKEFNGIKFEDYMPTDAYVFEKLRASNDPIEIEGVELKGEMRNKLTADRFAIRWYVVKYDPSDGFHVDGVIVAKPGTLVVQKTFSGDSSTIAAVKDKFYISVEHTVEEFTGGDNADTGVHKLDYKLTLDNNSTPKLNIGGYEATVGYTAYDAASDTYTWVIQGLQGVNYEVYEKNYDKPKNAADITAEASYSVSNKKGGGGIALTSYTDDGVGVQMAAYNDSTPRAEIQTINLHNSYTKPGVITVIKRDELTGGVIGGVKFTLTDAAGTAIELFKKPDTAEYSTQSGAPYTAAADSAYTDAHGHFFLELRPGKYSLTEDIPGGYFGAKKIAFEISSDNKVINVDTSDITDGAPLRDNSARWASVNAAGTTLTIENRARTFAVTVKNSWGDTPESEKRNIVIELYRNGAALGDKYTRTLAPDGYTTWKDLPLFVNGGIAQYSVRVSKIGDVYFSSILGITDGYNDYSVTNDRPVYSRTNGPEQSVPYWQEGADKDTVVFAEHLLLGVNIKPINGALSLKKHSDSITGPGLPGAEFGLYADESLKTELKVLISDEGGIISLDALSPGTYYLKESKAPEGYAADGVTYKVRVTGGVATTTRYKAADGTPYEGDEAIIPLTDLVNETCLALKVDNRTVEQGLERLHGAQIKLERIDGDDPVEIKTFTLANDAAREETVSLTPGTYRLTQLSAATGYEKYGEAYDFYIRDGELRPVVELMLLSLPFERDPGWEAGYDGEANAYLLTVYNEPVKPSPSTNPNPSPSTNPNPSPSTNPNPTSPVSTTIPAPGWSTGGNSANRLPQTGQVKWPVPVFAALGIALCAAGAHLMKKREKK